MAEKLSAEMISEIQSTIDNLFSLEQSKIDEFCRRLEYIVSFNQLDDSEPVYKYIILTLAQYHGMAHRLDKSLVYIEKAYDLAIRTNDKALELRARNNRAIVQFEMGEMYKAVEDWNVILTETENKGIRISCYQNLSTVYTYIGQHDKAMDYLYRIIHDLQDSSDHNSLGDAYNNLANAYRSLDHPQEALEHYRKALELFTIADNRQRIAMINSNICLAHIDLKDFETAHECALNALALTNK